MLPNAIIGVLERLVEAGAAVIVIANAGYVSDMGPDSKEQSGRIVVCGTPGGIQKSGDSIPKRYL